jgi:hypothetical protein
MKAITTFYNVNGAKAVKLDHPLNRKVKNKDRAPKPEEIAELLQVSSR